MSQQEDLPASLAKGAALNSASWQDFVARLRHDCVGEGVRNHHTADAIFKVEARKIVYGIDRDYTDKQAVLCDDSAWFSPQEYWDYLDKEEQAQLNKIAQHWHECDFLELDESDQWDQLDDIDDHRVVGWEEEWEYVNSHFTKDAAEAFIERKRHDYGKGIRVYVDAQTYCWEYNTIKEAILQGRIGLTDELQRAKEDSGMLLAALERARSALSDAAIKMKWSDIPAAQAMLRSVDEIDAAIAKAKGGAA